jgi:gliding motility-associated protein GldM
MGHGKETPRQKMIGLMYLFLTCMLALNVSKSVLDAFITINDRLNDTNENFISKNEIAYDAIDKAYASNKTKTEKVYKTALSLREKSDSSVL